MRKFWICIATLLCAATAGAEPTVLVTLVEGKHSLDKGVGNVVGLEAFMRLSQGDRIALPAKGRLTLIYLASARQENWQGSGHLSVGNGQSAVTGGKPQVEVRQLPPAIVRQINRTPAAATEGRVGMVRLRALKSDDALARLEKDYRDLKAQSPANDLTPEVFLLAGLFEQGEFERLESELQGLGAAFPGQTAVEALQKNYRAAIADARKK